MILYKQVNKNLFKEVGIFKFLKLLFNVFTIKLKIIFKRKKRSKMFENG